MIKLSKKLEVFDLNKIKLEIDLDNEFNNWLKDITFNKGYVIYVQKKNDSYIINQEPRVNGAIIVLDPYTGDVLAISGGFSFKKSEFNRVTQAKRQPGSAFKPIVYLTALNEGYSPATFIIRCTVCCRSRSRSSKMETFKLYR